MNLEKISNQEINEIFKGCLVTWFDGINKKTFPAGIGHISICEAVSWHQKKPGWMLSAFQIVKIELTEENKSKLSEWIAKNDK